jgi:hypothetical protein
MKITIAYQLSGLEIFVSAQMNIPGNNKAGYSSC